MPTTPTKQLPPLNAIIEDLVFELRKIQAARAVKSSPKVGSRVEELLREHPGLTRGEVAKTLGVHPRTVSKATEELSARGVAVRIGESRAARWYHIETINALRQEAWHRRQAFEHFDATETHEMVHH